jgi:hypothetical protein
VEKNQNEDTDVGYVSDGAGQPGSLDFGVVSEPGNPEALSLDPGTPSGLADDDTRATRHTNVVLRLLKRADVLLVLLLVAGMVGLIVANVRHETNQNNVASITDQYGTVKLPLNGYVANAQGISFGASSVSINGSLRVNDGLVVTPSVQPNAPTAGQLYYDQNTNQMAYYNGTSFIPLTGSQQVVSSVGGVSGAVTLGNGLSVIGNQLNVIFPTQTTSPSVTSLGGASGIIALGNGLNLVNNTLVNSGAQSLAAGSGISVANDGNGNYTISNTGAGSGTVTSPGGTAGQFALFDGAQDIVGSLLSQSGTTVTITGDLNVVTGGLSLGNALTVSNGGTGATSLASNGVVVSNGTAAFTSVTAAGSGLCLISTIGAPAFSACPGNSGVTSLNGQSGVLSIANASAAAGIVTIDNATTGGAKGIASFNSTNFTAASGVVNTIQDINTTAAPAFGRLSLNSSQATNPMLLVNNTNISATGNLLDLQLNGASKFSVQPGGNITTTGTVNGQTISNAASFTGTLGVSGNTTVGGTLNVNGGSIGSTGALNITPTGALTAGSATQTLTLQGNTSSTIAVTGGGNTTTLSFQAPSATVTYRLATAAAGTYDICTTVGNCAGTGGGVTTPGGTTNKLAKFTGSQAVGDSSITDTGTLVTSSANILIQGGTATVGVANSQTGTLSLAYGSANFTGSVTQGALTANRTYTLPDADGTICLSSGNCLGGGGGGANTALSNLSSVAINTSLLPGSTSIDLGSAAAPFRNLFIAGSSASPGTNNYEITGTATGARVITLPDASGTVCLNNSTNCGFLTGTGAAFVQNGNTFSATGVLGTTDAFDLNFITNSATRLSLNAAGSATFSGNVAINGSTLSSASALNITPGGTLTVGASSQALTLQGNASTTLTATGAGFTTTVGFNGAPTGAVTYNFDRSAAAGTYTICSTAGNCAGSGGGVTTSGGSTNQIVKFTGSQTIGDSSLSDNGTTVTTTGNLVVQGGSATIGIAATQTGTLLLADGGSAFSGSLTQGTLTAARTYTLPDSSGTFCLSSGNCASGGANTALSNLAGVAINTTLLPGAAGTINLGSSTLPFGDLHIAGTSASPGTNNFTITGTPTGARTITLPNASGTVCLNNSANCGFATGTGTAFVQSGNSFGATGVLGTTDNNGLNLITNSLTALGLSNTGDATFSGNVAVNGTTLSSAGALNITPAGTLTIGATNQALTLQGNASAKLTATGGGFTTTIGFSGTPTGAVNYNFDRAATAGTYTICTTAGNCAGTGGGVTTPGGTTNKVPKFTGSQTIGDSSISDNGTTVTTSGSLIVQGGSATIGVAATQTGTLLLADGASAFTGSLTQGTLTANRTYTLPDADGTICLSSGNCLGGGGGGANTSLSNLTSVAINTSLLPGSTSIDLGSGTAAFRNLYLAGSSASPASNNFQITGTATGARVITLPDATGTVCLNNSANCGFATGSGTAFVQNGNTFGGVGVLGTNDNNGLNLRTNGNTALGLSATGNATFSGNVAINGTTLSSAGALNITPAGTLTIGATTQALTLQGDASTTLAATGAGFTTTVGFTGTPSGAVTYNFDRAAAAGTYTICTTVGNCSGSGGGVTTVGGTSNKLAKFTGSQSIADSSLTDNGTTVTTTGNMVIQGGSATVGVAATQTGTLLLADGGSAFSGSLTQGTLTAARTYTLPDASGTVCLSSGNCLGGAGGGANTALSNLTGVAINTTLLPGAAGTINLGSATLPFGRLFIAGTSASPGTNNFTITGVATAGRTITLPDATGTVCLNGAASCGFTTGSGTAFVQNGNTFGGTGVLGTNDNNGLNLRTNGNTALGLSATGDATFSGAVTIQGTTLSSTGALSITPGSSLTVGATGQTLTLQGNASTTLTATGGGFTTTIGFSGSPVAGVNYNFDRSVAAGTYSICTSIGNCAGSGSGVTTTGGTNGTIAVFTGTQSLGDSLLSQSGSTVAVNGNLNLTSGHTYQINGTQISSADLSNDANIAKLSASETFSGATVTFKNASVDTTNAFSIQNAAGNSLFTADTSSGAIILGKASTLDGKLVFDNMTNANTTTLISGTPTANRTITFPDDSGTVCLNTGNCSGAGSTLQTAYNFSVGGTTPKIKLNTTLNGVDIQDADSTIGVDLFDVRASNGAGLGSVLVGIGNTGQVTLQNSANSGTAMQVLTQGGTRVFTVDTSAGSAILGQSTTLAGKLVFNNASNSNQVTLSAPAATTARAISLPDEAGTVCLQNSTNCGFALSAGGNTYIQNQNSTDQAADFRISGTGRANTAIITPLVDTASAVALDLGTTNATVINLKQNTTVATGKTFTVVGGATSLTGATSGDALTVSNSTSTGNIALFKDNSTAVFTIADSGLVTAKSLGTSTAAFDIQNSSSASLFSADTFNNTIHLRTIGRDNTSTFEAIWLQGSKNGVTALIGDNDDTSTYTANDFSGNLRFNGSNVGWGDVGYYPQGGGNGNNGQFRFSTTGSAVSTTPNAKVGVGDLYVAGNAGIGTNTPTSKLYVVSGTTADGTTIVSANTSGTQANGLLVSRNGSGGTTTNGIQISQSNGTLSSGLSFAGTIGVDIQRASGVLTMQGTGGVSLTSTSGNITLGTADAVSTLFVLDSSSAGSDPTGTNGAMYYNTSLGKFRCYQAGAWADCVAASGGFVSLQNAYTNSTGGSTSEIIVDGTRGALDIQDRSTTNGGTISANLLNVRATAANDSTAGASLFSVSSTGNVGIGTVAPTRTLDIATNNTNTTAPAARLLQSGSGDATFELNNSASAYYLGIDTSDSSKLKISSNVANGATFNIGETTTPTVYDSGNNNLISATKFTNGATAGTVSSISVYVGTVTGTPSNHMQVALYDDQGGTTPHNLLATSVSTALTPNAWNTFSIPTTSVSASTAYWLVFNVDGITTQYGFTSGSGNVIYRTTTYGSMPSDFTSAPGGTGAAGDHYHVYMTVTPSGTVDSFNNTLFSLTNTGKAVFKNSTNSTGAFQVQNSNGNAVLGVDTSAGNDGSFNVISNGGFENGTTGWTAKGGNNGFAVRNSIHHSGGASLEATTTAANAGVQYDLPLADNGFYTATFYVMLSSGDAPTSTIVAGYSSNGSTDNTACTQNTPTVSSTGWTRFTCYLNTPASHSGTPYFYIKQSDATGRTLYIDDVLVQTDNTNFAEAQNGSIDLQGTVSSPLTLQSGANSNNALTVLDSVGNPIMNVDTTSADNIIRNSSFEQSDAGWVSAVGNNGFFEDPTQSLFGNWSLRDTTNANANAGASYATGNTQPTALAINTTYTLSWYTKLSSGTFTDIKGRYTRNGSSFVECIPGNQTVLTTGWTRFSCTFTTDGTSPTSSAAVQIVQTAATGRTFWIDGVRLEAGSVAHTYGAGTLTMDAILGSPVTIRNKSDSTSAFNIQNAAGNTMFNVDTVNGQVSIQSVVNSNAALNLKNAAGTNILNVGTAPYSNEILNPDFEAGVATGWAVRGSAINLAASTTFSKFGRYSLFVRTNSSANNGVQYTVGLKPSTTYSFSFWARRDTASASAFNVGRADNGSDTDCLTGQTISSTWTQYSCTFTTGSTIGASSNVYLKQTDTSSDDIYIDGATLVQNGSPMNFQAVSTGLEVQNNGNSTLNSINSGEVQPWQLNSNPVTTNGTTAAPRSGAATVTSNGFVYVLGGGTTADGQTIVTTNNALYAKLNADGSVGAFAATSNLNTSVSNAGAVVVNGYVYLVGGKTGNADTTSSTNVQRAKINADGTLGTWSATTSQLTAAKSDLGVATSNGYIYAVGGFTTTGSGTNTAYYAKVNANGDITSWTQTGTNLTYSPSGNRSVVANGYLYSLGSNGSGSTTINYSRLGTNGAPGTWTANPTAMPSSFGDGATAVLNGYLYMVGGYDGSVDLKTTQYVPFNSDGTLSDFRTASNPLPNLLENMQAVVANGYMYIFGGDNTGGVFSTVLYTSGPRLTVSGSIDLVGNTSAQNLADGTTGGSITAGNGTFVGALQVQGQASFSQNVSVGGDLVVGGEINGGSISGLGLTDCSGPTSKLLYSSSTKQFSCGTDKPNVMIRKPSTETVTSSASLQDDDHFTFTAGANETWAFQISTTFSTTTTVPDIKFSIGTTASTSACTLAASDLYNVTNYYVSGCNTSTGTIDLAGTGDNEEFSIWGTVVTTGTGGPVTLRWSQATSSATSVVEGSGGYLLAYKMTGADLAESYHTHDSTIAPGDVVSVDTSMKGGVKKSEGVYDTGSLGIVSTAPGQILANDSDGADTTGKPVLLALSGRVPVKVSDENGPIKAGDYLTASSTPGVAMKATQPGQMIGKALEDYSGTGGSGVGTVLTFVDLDWADPNSNVQQDHLQANSVTAATLNVSGTSTFQDVVVNGTATINKLIVGTSIATQDITVNGSATFAGDINLSGVGLSRNAITKRFKASKAVPIGSVVIIDPSNDGQVTTTTTPNDTRVLGIALTAAAQAGDEITVAIGGSVQVRTVSGATIQGGDLLSSSSQEGLAAGSTVPVPGSLLGKALGKPANDMTWMIITLN